MGGALYLSSTTLSFDSGNNTFTRNRGKHGGVLFATGSRIESQSQSLFIINNFATGNGGGMHLSQYHLIFFNGMNELNENQAGNGGAIYASQSNLIVEAQSLTKMNSNLAICNRGALYLTMSI